MASIARVLGPSRAALARIARVLGRSRAPSARIARVSFAAPACAPGSAACVPAPIACAATFGGRGLRSGR
ncbi:MAG TPA: hypothetical protein VL738_15900, partial [Dactylosporangium sp.]|nr:hypothetical protein [Dactylosporangium sp.]